MRTLAQAEKPLESRNSDRIRGFQTHHTLTFVHSSGEGAVLGVASTEQGIELIQGDLAEGDNLFISPDLAKETLGPVGRSELWPSLAISCDLERFHGDSSGGLVMLSAARAIRGKSDHDIRAKVTHHGYDTHAENFNFHLEQLGEFDRTFCMLLDDLHDSGMLESTLVIVMSEFGRTPKINQRYGRDHWGTAWSIALGGCGIKPGAVIGKTNDEGTAVADREVDGRHLFHTYYQAVGLDATQKFFTNGRPVPKAPDTAFPIKEILA